MRKAELVQRIAEELGCTQGQAAAAVAAILTTIKETLRDGEPVCLRRFGTWQVHAKRGRTSVGPEDGDRGRDCGPAGRALWREPDAEAGGRRGRQPRGLSQHVSALPEPGAPRRWSDGHHAVTTPLAMAVLSVTNTRHT